jgi:uncharacterized protein YndB with AHSA1/START domain
MIDVIQQINAVHRTVAAGTAEAGEVRVVTIRRSYDGATVEELWDACTNPERIPRWFLPVSGELRVGGRYQLQGNAGGTITACDAPHRFEATWEFGESVTWIAVSLAAAPSGEGADLTLEHTVPVDDHWAQYGPGAVGVGWEQGLQGLSLHLASGGAAVDPAEFAKWSASDDGLRFATMSSEAWGEAHAGSGITDAADAAGQAARTTAAYTGAPPG